jgi:hypothetical protein
MRQMVSMMFQIFCKDFPNLQVEITTALCGEEAVRLSRLKHFHLITMDQTLSSGYCKSVLETQANARTEALAHGGAEDVQSAGNIGLADSTELTIDSDRLETAKRRTTFFKNELMHHEVIVDMLT